MSKKNLAVIIIGIALLVAAIVQFRPTFQQDAGVAPPATLPNESVNTGDMVKPCSNENPGWRHAQVIDGVEVEESPACEPDNPYDVVAAVKGTNNISMATLMQTRMAQDAVVMGEDLDKDGDPDVIDIKLEIMELNGGSPDGDFLINTFDVAPGIQPGLWVFAPKSQGMGVKSFTTFAANPLLRAPSPTIRVEQGDKVTITLENTHYLPHTIHLHGVDHPWETAKGDDNDGMDEHPVFPGQSHTYEIQPRHTGTMLYHCHVQTARHMMMGLSGMFVIEENQPNNWVQTFNVGAGQVRHRSVASKKAYSQEYDLVYQSLDKKLTQLVQEYGDVRLIANKMTRDYNMTESVENYFLLNGHSYPYTLRDSTIIASGNENIKLRVANTQRSAIALHFHGHKATITAYDGVEQPIGQQITRDVFDVAPAQRIDLQLQTIDDGLHSYGKGLWMFHDHVPTGTMSDGMEPGGNMAILAYKPLVDEQGMPKMHTESLDELFNKKYYSKQQSLWDTGEFSHLLGQAAMFEVNMVQLAVFGLAVGLLIGLAIVLIFAYKRKNSQ